MPDYQPVLAMYDIRGKQDFIFRTNKLQEIVGGSWIIRDLYKDYLYPVAKKLDGGKEKGIFSYKEIKERCDGTGEEYTAEQLQFSPERFLKHMEEGYLGEVVYDGGGNFILLFRDVQTFQNVTYAFTKRVLEEIGTLRVLGTYIEDVNFENYNSDNRRLYAKHRIGEAQESNVMPWACLPIVQVDRKTSMPILIKNEIGEEYSLESNAKIKKYRAEIQRMRRKENRINLSEVEREFYLNNEDKLDRLILEKGVDSQVAVVYMDGNNMGAKVQEATKNCTSYVDCVSRLRKFSDDIQRTYVENGIRNALSGIEIKDSSYRIVVSAGDEINFIVNAHDAFKCTMKYFDSLKEGDRASACAGIAVFNSHAPYADAYRIAEEACESGKQKMKELGLNNACFVDFHFCQGTIGVSLEKIREKENGDVISRPWLVWKDDPVESSDQKDMNHPKSEPEDKEKRFTDFQDIRRIINILQDFGRSNVKNLMHAALTSETDLNMELNRMFAHLEDEKKPKIQAEWKWMSDYWNKRQALYDIVLGFDMWFDRDDY